MNSHRFLSVVASSIWARSLTTILAIGPIASVSASVTVLRNSVATVPLGDVLSLGLYTTTGAARDWITLGRAASFSTFLPLRLGSSLCGTIRSSFGNAD